MLISRFILLSRGPGRIGLHTVISNIPFHTVSLSLSLSYGLRHLTCVQSLVCALLNRQNVANKRQSRAAQAEQGSVIQNNTVTARNYGYDAPVYVGARFCY